MREERGPDALEVDVEIDGDIRARALRELPPQTRDAVETLLLVEYDHIIDRCVRL